MASLVLSPTHATSPGELKLTLDLSAFHEPAENVAVSLMFDFVGPKREAFSFSQHGIALREGDSAITFQVPPDVEEGLHQLIDVQLASTDGSGKIISLREQGFCNDIYVEIGTLVGEPASAQALKEQAQAIRNDRQNWHKTPFETPDAKQSPSLAADFRCIVFAFGADIPHRQDLQGFTLHPVGRGVSYSALRDSISEFLMQVANDEVPFDNGVDARYRSSTPVGAIEFHHVKAVTAADALNFARRYAGDIFLTIGLERGATAQVFAGYVDYGLQGFIHFQFPGYSGNLLSGLFRDDVAVRIERDLPALQRSPVIRLLYETYSNALSERDPGYKFLKFWTILETCARDNVQKGLRISDPSGSIILNDRNQPFSTDHIAPRVYKYLFDLPAINTQGSAIIGGANVQYQFEGGTAVPAQAGTEHYSLWEVVRALYVVRNAMAHGGAYQPNLSAAPRSPEWIANRYFAQAPDVLLGQMRLYASLAIGKEIAQLGP